MRELMEKAEKRGGKTELITLKDRDIQACDGCLTCEKTSVCHIKDDMQEIYDKMLSADAIVLGSPTYFDAPTGSAMNFIHRTYPLYGRIKGKRFVGVIVGQLSGDDGVSSRGKVEDYFKAIAGTHGLDYRGSLSVSARDPNDASKITDVREQCEDLATRILKQS
ncbi:flavodoxin family protein [Candidatus Bathyarchaeota archaeon]|nr:flavodoxin family protein [Candidatus Bathyarchaeota archaeon]